MISSEPQEPAASSLIVRIAERRDRAAFAALFTDCAPKVKAFLMRRGASAAAAEELTQEVMLTVWRKAAYFDPRRGSGEAWLFALARNVAIDAHRRELGRSLIDFDPLEGQAEAPRGDRTLEAAQEADRVSAALSRLPPEQLEVVRLSFFDDRPHSEISTLLGLPLGTVKSRLRLAMSRLKDLLDDLA